MSGSGSRGRLRRSVSSRTSSSHDDNHNISDAQHEDPVDVRGPSHVPARPNLDARPTLGVITILTKKAFDNQRAVRLLSSLCLNNWPTAAITWETQTEAHHNLVWKTFKLYYVWDPSIEGTIKKIFNQKCKERTRQQIKRYRDGALAEAAREHENEDPYMYAHLYNPWWVTQDIWAQMMNIWKQDNYREKMAIASRNWASNVAEGERPRGTYRSGSRSMAIHYERMRASNEGQITWLDVYVHTRNGIPDAIKIAYDYRQLMDAKYPSDTERPIIDKELWIRASKSKGFYIKGWGRFKRKIFSFGSSSSSSTVPQAAQVVDEICQNPELMTQIIHGLRDLHGD